MKNLCFLILFLLSKNCHAQPQIVPETDQSTDPMSATVYKNRDGKYRFYKIGETKPYTGILYGKYANGNYETWQTYIDGRGQGTWINYYENGHLKEVGNYNENRVEGPIKKYHPNGQLAAKGTYRDWRIHVGEWKFYDTNGQLIKTENYGQKGDFSEVEAYYRRGDISKSWYEQIIATKSN